MSSVIAATDRLVALALDSHALAAMIAYGENVYGVTIPAYNVWHACEVAGLVARDYGQTWHVYASRAEYLDSLD
jgi:hypothetical protein